VAESSFLVLKGLEESKSKQISFKVSRARVFYASFQPLSPSAMNLR